LFGAVALAAHDFNALALKSDGTVVEWGGAANPPTGLSNVVSIACNTYSGAALKNDGTIVIWGAGVIFGAIPELNGLSNVVQVTVDDYNFGLALRTDGTVTYANDLSYPGQQYPQGLTNLPGFSNIVTVSAGYGHGLALKSDSTVLGIGVTLPTGLTNVLATACGYGYDLLLVSGGPVIVTQPVSLTVNGGESATFSVVAAGAPPFSYQWQKNGTSLDGATNATLSFITAQASDAASYTVVVTDPGGSVMSVPASLSVNLLPGVVVPPSGATVFVGGLARFNVSANGAVPRTYQWLKDGSVLGGAPDSNLTLTAVQSGDAGAYSVAVCNSYGCITSSPAALIVVPHTFSFPPPGTVVGLGGPMVPPGLTNVIAIAAGSSHSLALRSDGTVVAWGRNNLHECDVPAGLSNVVALAAGEETSFALKADGTIATWGYSSGSAPANLFGVVAISAQSLGGLALRADGRVVSWGTASASSDWSNVVAVAATDSGGLALRSDGMLLVSGGLIPPPGGLTNVIGMAGGLTLYLAVRTDGELSQFDHYAYPPAWVNLPGFSNIVAVSAGELGNWLSLRNDGAVQGPGIPGGLKNVVAISTGGSSLLITTNPPAPSLASGMSGGNLVISAPVSVSGYVLEASDDLSLPFSVVAVFTNGPPPDPTISLPITGPKKFYRLRKL
jgi:hypothetical protein